MRKRYDHIPWSDMAQQRDKTAHHYWGVQYGLIWDTGTVKLPPLKPLLEAMLHDLESEQ